MKKVTLMPACATESSVLGGSQKWKQEQSCSSGLAFVRWFYFYAGSVLILFCGVLPIAITQAATKVTTPLPNVAPVENENTGWALHVDNDILAGGERDQDYTGGITFTLSGRRAVNYQLSLDSLRGRLDRLTGFDRLYQDDQYFSRHSMEFGFALFTPLDITVSTPQFNDRPYASLFFLGNSRLTVVPSKGISYQSLFLIGALGLRLADTTQSIFHRVISGDQPQGWDHQISDGGEPTARYSVGMQKKLIPATGESSKRHEFKVTTEASVGFTTDVNAGFNYRIGKLSTRWWSFNPHQGEYVSIGPPASNETLKRQREFYVYVGGAIKYRIYNAILQGQFRDSDVEYDRGDLQEVVMEAWGGVSYEFSDQWRLTAFIRGRTAELDTKSVSRSPLWGGFVISRSY